MRTIVDLRSSAELEHTGRGPLERTDIAFVHAPLSHSQNGVYVLPPSLADGDLGAHYVASLVDRTETLAEVIALLATAEHLPAVFHCTAGKDRTGMVAALVLSLVGVADDVIVEDYALTDDRMELVMEAIRASGGVTQLPPEIAARVARAEASSMERFLAGTRRRLRRCRRLGSRGGPRRRHARVVARRPRAARLIRIHATRQFDVDPNSPVIVTLDPCPTHLVVVVSTGSASAWSCWSSAPVRHRGSCSGRWVTH